MPWHRVTQLQYEGASLVPVLGERLLFAYRPRERAQVRHGQKGVWQEGEAAGALT